LAALGALMQSAMFEQLDLAAQTLVEGVQILALEAVLEAHHFRKQVRGGRHQRIEADVEALRRTQARGEDHAFFELLEFRRRTEIGQRAFCARFTLAVEDDRLVILAVFHFLGCHGQFLIAQNFSSSPVNSPDTWKAKPPERSSCASSSELSSKAK